MKKFFLTALLLNFSLCFFSQNTQGKALYLEYIDMTEAINESNKAMDSAASKNDQRAAQMGAFKEQLNTFLKSLEETETELFFQGDISLYKERQQELTADEVNNEQSMFARWKPAHDEVYLNLDEKRRVVTKDFMGKAFLIKDDLKNYEWKVTGKQEMIAGYPSMQAIHEDTNVTIEAWFTPQIPVSIGPQGLNGLPGLITKASYKLVAKEVKNDSTPERGRMRRMMRMMQNNGGNLTVTLKEISFDEPSKSDIREPKKGKVVSSEEEYNKIIEERVKEMQQMRGGGRGRGPR